MDESVRVVFLESFLDEVSTRKVKKVFAKFGFEKNSNNW